MKEKLIEFLAGLFVGLPVVVHSYKTWIRWYHKFRKTYGKS